MYILYWEAQNWTKHSRCGFTSGEKTEKLTSVHLLATHLQMQPKIPLAFFPFEHMASSCSTCVYQDLQVFAPKPVLLPGAVHPKVQCFVLFLVEFQEVPVSPFLQPGKVCLDVSTALWHISFLSQFGVICKYAEGTLCPITQMIHDTWWSSLCSCPRSLFIRSWTVIGKGYINLIMLLCYISRNVCV